MHHDTTPCALPALPSDFLRSNNCLVDNLFADLWKEVGIKTLLTRCGFRKRSGVPVNEVLYSLTLWVWLKVNSVSLFARQSLSTFCAGSKDVLFEALKREDWNWRALHQRIAIVAIHKIRGTDPSAAFVLDDTIKVRHGKKMPGVSSHFDHTTGRHVMGQQILTLGLSCAQGFIPVDSELFISAVKAQGLKAPFLDGRSVTAKRYSVAKDQTKPQMAKAMISRAQRLGIDARYLVADAWFGTKKMIAIAEDALLTPIVRMKKNTMKYRYRQITGGQVICREMDVSALYRDAVRGRWVKVPGQLHQSKTVDVELNLNESKDDTQRWVKVRLLFVRAMAEGDKPTPGKHDWAVFLTTDRALTPQRMLELYAMRWAIEVYFKEVKQHLGFMREQGTHYAGYIASMHLAAIRFCLLAIAKHQHQASSLPEMRRQLCTNVSHIDYASRLWQFFRALISGALEEVKTLLGDKLDVLMQTIDLHVNRFFVQALQLDTKLLRMEAL